MMNAKTPIPHHSISARAKKIWEEAGQPEGQDITHWLRAEKELSAERSQSEAASSSSQPAATAGNESAKSATTSNPASNRANSTSPRSGKKTAR